MKIDVKIESPTKLNIEQHTMIEKKAKVLLFCQLTGDQASPW